MPLYKRVAAQIVGPTVYNESGADADFRMEGDTDANLFYLDASTDRIGVRTATPASTFHTIGNVQVGDATTETKGYRLRTNGSSLDFDFHSAALLLSGFDGPGGYSGTQREKLVLKVGEDTSQLCGDWEVSLTPFGGAHHWFGSGALNGDFIVNEDSTESDFRVETGTDTHAIFADGATDKVGIGEATPAEKLDVAGNFRLEGSAYFDAEVDNGNSGAADTVDWTAGNKQKSTLTAATPAFTFTAPGGPCNLLLKLVQDATGSRNPSWPATVKWAGGAEPTWSTGANAIDIVTFYYDGTNYYGQAGIGFA